jgi:hypothetical protein
MSVQLSTVLIGHLGYHLRIDAPDGSLIVPITRQEPYPRRSLYLALPKVNIEGSHFHFTSLDEISSQVFRRLCAINVHASP